MYFKDVRLMTEYNSSYEFGELRRKFIAFAENFDSLGLKAEDVEIDLGGKTPDTMMDEDTIDTMESRDEELKHIPAIWVLVDDNDLHPIFKPIKTDAHGVDFDKASAMYGLDFIDLSTDYTEIVKSVTMIIDGQEFRTVGKLRDVQRFVIRTVEYLETRQQILTAIEQTFFEPEVVHSFSVTIPEHRKHCVIGIK